MKTKQQINQHGKGHKIERKNLKSASHSPKLRNTLQSLTIDKKNSALFFNRELSWLQFNYRVLKEAARKDNPLLERLKFLSIFESNLIEFFMIRVAGLKQMKASSYNELQLDGRTPLQTLQEISRITGTHLHEMDSILKEIYHGLSEVGISIIANHEELKPHEKKFSYQYFHSEIFRILTPLAVDPGHPFPRITNTRLNLVVVLERKTGTKKSEEAQAFIEVPSVLPRFIQLPSKSKTNPINKEKPGSPHLRFILIEEIIKLYLKDLFIGTKIKNVSSFTIIRNNELAIDEVASDNLLSTIEDELKNRRWGEVVCLQCHQSLPINVQQFLRQELDIEEHEVHRRPGLLNVQNFRQLYEQLSPNYPELCNPPFIPRNSLSVSENTKGDTDIFSIIRKKERLFHHPYDSFQSVIDLISSAAKDPKVLAIKQTLYRTGKDSPFVASLIEAAENGKQVTALVELKALFDEERNINWAREMENHGVHVVYGLVGLKIHGKILQIIRREKMGARSYTHLSTGNYNATTARLYTDLGLMTAEPEINHEVSNLFHSLTGIATVPYFKKIAAAPINLRYSLLRLLQQEIANAKKGKPARIRLKMNSLVDPEMIIALYRASQAQVKIDLNVRGTCCLRPGILGVSENIRVVSIIGRFLEHSRIFHFENGGQPRLFLSSADWMPRNLNRRVEILFPVNEAEHKERLLSLLDSSFADNYNLSELKANGSYKHALSKPSEARFSSQHFFCQQASKELQKLAKEKQVRRRTIFQPLTNPDQKSELAKNRDS